MDAVKQEVADLVHRAVSEHFGEVTRVSPLHVVVRIPDCSGSRYYGPRYFNVKVSESV